MPRVRGSSHQTTTLYLAQRFGEDAIDLVYGDLPERERSLLKTVRATDWCPLDLYAHYMVAADKRYGKGDLELCRELGDASSRWQAPELRQTALRTHTPKKVIEGTQKAWQKLYDRGKWETDWHAPTAVQMRLCEFNPVHAAVCARFAGFFRGALDLAGAHIPDVTHTACVLSGAPTCDFLLVWTARG
jgi:hypothetical protein